MILVDTSVWIDFLTGAETPHRHELHRLIEEGDEVGLPEISLAEILQGIRSDTQFKKTKDYLLNFPIFGPAGVETYIQSSEIYRQCRRKGITVRSTIDCLITSIAIEKKAQLMQRDRDFENIAGVVGLKLYSV